MTGQGARVLRQVSLRFPGALAVALNDVITRHIAPAGGTLPPVVFVTSLDAHWAAALPPILWEGTGPCVKAPPSSTHTTHSRPTWVLTR